MTQLFGGHTVLITGGASGIGFATAEQLATQGATIVLMDRDDNVAAALSRLPGTGHRALVADVTDETAVETAISGLFNELPITDVVAAAGIVSQTPLLQLSSAEFRTVLDVNVLGVHHVLSSVARHMLAHKLTGSFVVMGSAAAFNGGGLMGKGGYSASKAALNGLVRSYARELGAQGIRTNLIAPAATETPMTATLTEEQRATITAGSPLGRFLTQDEIVAAIEFLVTDRASAVNGQTIHVNGGLYFA